MSRESIGHLLRFAPQGEVRRLRRLRRKHRIIYACMIVAIVVVLALAIGVQILRHIQGETS